MGSKPSTLDKALAGDEEALETVLGGVVAPLFDLALHLTGSVERAAKAARDALAELAAQIRGGRLEHPEPLVAAVAGLVLDGAAAPIDGLEGTEPLARRAFLTALATDVRGEPLDRVLGLEPGRADALLRGVLDATGIDESTWRRRLDERASRVSLPEGLLDTVV